MEDKLRFVVGKGKWEKYRVDTVWSKEPGTVKWLKKNVLPGDICYDIGANIGIYTMIMAHLLGPGGMVYAFEPHLANAGRLVHNTFLNHFTDRVRVIASALHNQTGFYPFNYKDDDPGATGSQLNTTFNEFGQSFQPSAIELKHSATVDDLLDSGIILPPALIKLDVDGNELNILAGMDALLRHRPPRTIQVETHHKDDKPTVDFMEAHGYRLVERHFTEGGAELLAKGTPAEKIAQSLVFMAGQNGT